MALLRDMAINTVGEIAYLNINNINWDIPSFHMLPVIEGSRIWSPEFYFCNGYNPTFRKKVEFSQHFYGTEEGYVGLFFSSTEDILFNTPNCVRIGMVNKQNEVINCSVPERITTREWFGGSSGFYRVRKLFNKKEIFGRIFRLFCENITIPECQILIFPHQQEAACVGTVAKKSVDDRECNDTLLKNCNVKKDDINRQEIKNLVKLSQNLMNLYLEGKDSDLTIKVKDREFKAHKAILRARSSVFDAMFSHDLSETNSGVVPIEDCEPGIFQEFLYFVYAGKTQHLSSDNMCELYYVADKYDLEELKEECISFLQKSLSIETICDVICLSTKHNETKLLEIAIVFFARNMDDILVTNKWQLFLQENPIKANELCIKALKMGFRKIKI